mmetsp:Transcript_44004/g.107517  ORF Transcript_44004/g.107517 Transcript_44004/m.107517 type:complete len:208 (-) Transcript_44004:1014-1637(-)
MGASLCSFHSRRLRPCARASTSRGGRSGECSGGRTRACACARCTVGTSSTPLWASMRADSTRRASPSRRFASSTVPRTSTPRLSPCCAAASQATPPRRARASSTRCGGRAGDPRRPLRIQRLASCSRRREISRCCTSAPSLRASRCCSRLRASWWAMPLLHSTSTGTEPFPPRSSMGDSSGLACPSALRRSNLSSRSSTRTAMARSR